MVIWFQGCSLGCVGCFNPSTHATSAGQIVSVADLLCQIACIDKEVEGITITGGEPFQQASALAVLLNGIREKTGLSILVFSGYTRIEIERMPLGSSILGVVDVLISGRFLQSLHSGRGLLGSSNQEVCFLTTRYGPSDFSRIPAAELRVSTNGVVEMTGIRPIQLLTILTGKT